MYTAKIVASDNNIPTTFGTGAGSLIVNGAPSSGALGVINTTESVLYVAVTSSPTVVPVSTLPGKCIPIPAAPTGGTGVAVFDLLKITKGDLIYIRNDSGSAVSAGSVYLFLK